MLDVLVSGPLPPDPGEFAASYRLAEILAQLRKLYDTVVIDTPPLLWVGDALTLSSQADGIIVIARMKALRRPMLRELRRILDLAPARKLGFVITGPVSTERGRLQPQGRLLVRLRVRLRQLGPRADRGACRRREARQRRRECAAPAGTVSQGERSE